MRARGAGPRVLIRRPAAEDRDEVVALTRASAPFHGGWISPPATPEAFERYLEQCAREDFEGLLVCRREDGAIMGAVNLSQIFYGSFRSAYTGYYIGAPFARQGYMTEALWLVLRHAFTMLRLHRLEANVQPGNAASIALVRRVGFRLEGYSPRYLKIGGRWRDHERWAILREEWRGRPRS